MMEKEQKQTTTSSDTTTSLHKKAGASTESVTLVEEKESFRDHEHPQTSPTTSSSSRTTRATDEDEDDANLMAQWMNTPLKKHKRHEIGELLTARVVRVGGQFVFLDVGGKSEASIGLEEVLDKDGNPPKVGDKLEAYVININQGNLELGKSIPGTDDAMLALEDALDKQIPVEGTVKGVNKGGLDVEVFGKRAFCPISQIELRFCDNASKYLNQTLKFRVMEVKEGGRNIVVSRRALLEEEQQAEMQKLLARIQEGVELEGTVQSLKDYGAFVDIGNGVQGLLHVSEISHHRIQHPQESLEVGQKVRVKVTQYNPETKKLSLSMKAIQKDPWDDAAEHFKPGSVVTGTVSRLQPFGAFVELALGIEGLLHVSQISHRRIHHPKEVVNVGDRVECKVLELDREKKRISLSLKELNTDGLPPAVEGGVGEGKILDGIIDKIEPFGIFIRLPDNKKGLLPNAELNVPRGSDLSRTYPLESTLQVMVQSVDSTGRIRLSQKAIEQHRQQQEYQEYRQQSAQEEKRQEGFGTSLGALLNKFKK